MDKDKYEILLEELISILKMKNEKILILQSEIDRLKTKLDDITKKEINFFKKMADDKSKIETRRNK